jgi:hypothetical protein
VLDSVTSHFSFLTKTQLDMVFKPENFKKFGNFEKNPKKILLFLTKNYLLLESNIAS